MKKLTAVFLMIVLLAGCCCISAFGDDKESKYDRLRVGTTTPFTGNFFSDAIGNNVSDQDVRKLIHGYNLVEWLPEEGVFRPNPQVVTGITSSGDETTYIFVISQELTYNDGTPITAKDYAFSFLLQTSGALKEAAGTRRDGDFIEGWKAYDEGTSSAVEGFRLMGDYQFSITLNPEYVPYYYQMQALSIQPYPAAVIAPGIEVKDNGEGICLSGPLTAETLGKTLLDPENGYASHPGVTCGPYQLISYDGTRAEFELNPAYIGDSNGVKSRISRIEYVCEDPDELINDLARGQIDLAVRCARNSQIQGGLALVTSGDFKQYAYSRNGLAFISFCAEDGATADPRVRQALAMCMDKEALKDRYLGNYGMAVDGYYGIGQWMYLAANGTIRVGNEGEKAADEGEPEKTELRLTAYAPDPARAEELLAEAGWTLDERGDPYDPKTSAGVRCKNVQGRLVKLRLRLIYAENNGAGALLSETFARNVKAVGGELETEAVPMDELLEKYYHTAERDCDMIMLGTNFGDVFEPSAEFDGDTHILSGIEDRQFASLAADLRRTPPGRALDYVKKWAEFIAYRSTILPEIPLYSNVYMDFAAAELQGYEPGNYPSWAEAVQYAVMSDPGENEAVFE